MEHNYVKNFEVFADAWADRYELVSLADLDKWLCLPKYEHDDLTKRPYFSWIDLAVREGKLNIYRANGLDFDTEKIALLKVFVNRIDNYDASPIRRVHFIRNEIIPYLDEIKKFLRMYAATFVENIWEYHAQIDKLKATIVDLESAQQKSTTRGSAGSEAASAKRVASWREIYVPAMVKAAVELGQEGPKSGAERRQRKDVATILDYYSEGVSEIPGVLDVFYKALPDEYVDRTGGNCPMK